MRRYVYIHVHDIYRQSDNMWNDGKMMEAEEVAWRIKHLLCRSEG